MDDSVKQAMVKWPNVPHCYGWLALDARGGWRMRDETAQQAGLAGDRIVHEALLGFINRNYASDDDGRWYFQNGPQRVYVDLEATPYVARTDPAQGFLLQTGEALAQFDAVYMSERGQLILQGGGKLAVVDDRDLAQCTGALSMDGAPASDERLLQWLGEAEPAPMTLKHQGRELPVQRVASATLAQQFGFVQQPRA
ncbi:MAG: DUF2946 family protein [Noviherbaspirillum sp.]